MQSEQFGSDCIKTFVYDVQCLSEIVVTICEYRVE